MRPRKDLSVYLRAYQKWKEGEKKNLDLLFSKKKREKNFVGSNKRFENFRYVVYGHIHKGYGDFEIKRKCTFRESDPWLTYK